MKIIYLHQYFNTPNMSGGTRSYEMARRLVAAGHEVHMITSWRKEGSTKTGWFTTTEQGINVHWFPVPYANTMSYVQRIRAFFDFALAAKRKAVEIRGDVVFATSTPLTIAIPAVFAAKKHQVPMVFEVRDLWPELPVAIGALRNPASIMLAKMLEKWAYRNSDAVIALSPGMRDGVIKTGYPGDRVAVIPNSSDNREFKHDSAAATAFRKARSWLGERPLLVYTGTFGRINGVGYMVELAREIRNIDPEIRILLVGAGQEREQIIQQAKNQGVFEQNLFFEERLPKKEIPALLSAANMASSLFLNLKEMQANSANKFFDALASSTPVMINYGGWQHELIETHKCGLAMWRKPIREAAEIITKALRDEVWLAQTSTAARQLAEDKFDRDLLAQQLERVISAAANRAANEVKLITTENYP